eukprot:CAMPEP_0170993026 /NCGR_PEP_ID=MMETSP0736-20130129/10090_1 /TAXON_ID=186038 /ORGANISM="Fragilariopsis kerguelensis, Strain L26-C5" /LENGTH=408 /DNA_ID=CAMNT_0011418589 /DNA_START=172 /DNA_END=1398 /DNA_ORIENTATION=+
MVASPLNLYLLPSLSTKNDYASIPSAASTAATATSINSIGQGQPLSRPGTSRPRRKKMASVGVEAMRNMIMTTTTDDSSTSATTTLSSTAADAATAVAVSIPASPSTFEHEREDVIFQSTNNRRAVLSIPSSAPMMPPLPMMPDLTTSTPVTTTIRRSNTSSIVFPRKRVNNNKRIELSNAQLPVPVPVPTLPTKKMKKAKSKQVLRQIKRGLLLEFISSKHQQHEEGCGCSSGRTSTTVSTSTSTSSLLMATPQSESESFVDEITIPTIMLAPRFRMFHEDIEEQEQQEQVTMIKPAAPWSTQLPSLSSSSSKQVVVPTTTTTQPTPSLLSASLNKALSVLAVSSRNDDDDNEDDNDNDWGIFVSFGDDEDEKEHDHERECNNNYDCYSPLNNRSYLPVFAEGLWIQ